ncbi:MAG: pyridoxal phosphate-dependent aminotransferase [Terriglobia bacterium]
MFSRRTHWPLALNRLSQVLEKRRGLPIIDLTESNPTRCGFVYESDRIRRALTSAASLSYRPDPWGPQEAREAVATYYRERGVSLDPRQIFITGSTSEAYSYVFRLLADAGDQVLAPQPSYPLFDFLAQLDDITIRPYPLAYGDGWQIDRLALQERIRPESRAMLLVNPNNPTGSYVSSDDRAFVVELCRQLDLALVADEVFFDYLLESPDGGRAQSLAGETTALTFTLSGLSKISALPQMKLAWIAVNGPAELRDTAIDRLEVIADTYLSVSAPLGLALPELLDTRFSIQPQIQKRTQTNLMRLDTLLSVRSPVSRLNAEGGWSAVLRVPGVCSDEDWAITLLERDNVLIHPGHFYDFPGGGYLVVSLLTKPENFEEGVRRLLTRIQNHA